MKQISLLYHDVVGVDADSSGFPGAAANIYKLQRETFSAHLEAVAGLGNPEVRVLGRPGDLAKGPPPILYTFDDGGVSALEPTASLLEAHGWRGHFYVVTERIGQPGFLTREQIVELRRRGHHIGSHSHSHPSRFSQLGWDRMVHEWRESRRILAEILGEPVWSASVPGGFYSRQVALAARKAGYELLFTSEPNADVGDVEGLRVLGRYDIRRDTSAAYARSLARADFVPRAMQSLVWNAKKPLKRLGGKAWLTFRRWFFEKSA